MTLDTDKLYLDHRPALICYAMRILGSREAAEDIVQEAYLRFLPETSKAAKPRDALSYLYRVVRNLSFDVLKRRKVEQKAQSCDPPFWIVPQLADTAEQTLMVGDEVRIAQQVLASLPRDMRVAVEMYRFGGETLETVAEHLGVSVATAHRHIRTAMVKIAVALDRKNN